MKQLYLFAFTLLLASALYGQALTGDYFIPQGTNARGFATLAEACSSVTANGLSGTVRLLIDNNLNETGANLYIKRSDLTAANRLVIKPAAGKNPVITITGCTATAGPNQYTGITFDTTSYVTIDGSNAVGGNSRDLTIVLDDSTNGRIGMQFYSNCDVIDIKNLNIIYNKIIPLNSLTRGIYVNGQATGVADSFMVTNCVIGSPATMPAYAISVTGSSTGTQYCSRVYLRKNQCYATLRRLYFFLVGTPDAMCEISGNEVNGGKPPVTGNVVWGILLNDYAGPVTIAGNKLHILRDTTNTTSGLYGFGTLSSRAGATLNIINNFFGGDYTHTGTGIPASVDIVSFQDTCRQVKMYFNTIYLNSMAKTASARMTAVRMGVGTIEMKNNIFITDKNDTTVALIRNDGATLVSNYNDFFIDNAPNAAIASLGGARYLTLADWKAVSGQDSNSYTLNPGITGPLDFHILSDISPILGKGTPIAAVQRDIDGDLRDTPPDLGADERIALIPVNFTSFSVSRTPQGALLNWSTSNEHNNSGFTVERGVMERGSIRYTAIGTVAPVTVSTGRNDYRFTDAHTAAGKVYYRIRQNDYDGSFMYSATAEYDWTLPAEFALRQNYPNPFNPTTAIAFSLAEDGLTNLAIYSVTGELVTTLTHQLLTTGNHIVAFNAAGLPSGVYMAVLSAGGKRATIKMNLIK